MNRCKSEKSTKISNLWSLLFQLPSSATNLSLWVVMIRFSIQSVSRCHRTEIQKAGSPYAGQTTIRPMDTYLFWKSCWFFSWFFLVCVFFGPKQKTLHLCPGWSPGYWVLKSDTSRIQWNRVPLIASKSSSWKPEMWMALEFWSWNKNDSEYFHFHQFWAKRDLPV